MIDAKKILKTNDFYDWYPEVIMAWDGGVKLCAVVDFKLGKIKYKVSFLKNYRTKEVGFNVLDDAVKYYNERVR